MQYEYFCSSDIFLVYGCILPVVSMRTRPRCTCAHSIGVLRRSSRTSVDSRCTCSRCDLIHSRARRGSSAKNISLRAEWLRQSGRAPSEPSETPRWWITPRAALIPRAALHIALRSLFHRFFSLCRSPILNELSGSEGQL